jgi:hypothetical protein
MGRHKAVPLPRIIEMIHIKAEKACSSLQDCGNPEDYLGSFLLSGRAAG